ncbi:putative RNA splicing protein mrs2, mitochondrial [Corchorus capsularis]|uniref:Putative RNA splicing protein mrs2, mitochondrial n=1 Tax=Corchorus capsularis TaxID=210143 RepID=A0A1R3IKN5_COCAP|nr:putative RNA splicing protein mrs2, mitochondrial [Corchorus capsularis]
MAEIEVVEVALLSRIQRLEQRLMDLKPRVELGSRAGALKGNDDVECSVPLEKQIAEEEEEEIEMLLENYLQRCESCHGQAARLLDSGKEMEDSIAVNLRIINGD